MLDQAERRSEELEPVEAEFYFRGIPTEPDVRALKKKYPNEVMEVGFTIPYADVAKIIDVSPDSNRFKTVTSRWRKEFEDESGKVLEPSGNKTFRVNNASENLHLTKRKTRTAIRATHRSTCVCKLTDRRRLSSDEKKQFDHVKNINAKIVASAQTRGKDNLPTLEDTTRRTK